MSQKSFHAPRQAAVLTLLSLFLLISLQPFSADGAEDSASIYFAHAMKSKQEGQFLTAERLLQKAIEIAPENADYHFELGNLYLEKNNLNGGRLELEQATMIEPAHLAARYNLGLVYRELGMMGEAREQFRRVLDLDPRNIKAQLQIGYTYQQEGFSEDARQAFEEARQMDITDPEPRSALEDLADYEKQGRERSNNQMEHSLWQNQQFLSGQSTPAVQPSGRDAFLQAGSLLIQQLLARRAQSRSQDESETSR